MHFFVHFCTVFYITYFGYTLYLFVKKHTKSDTKQYTNQYNYKSTINIPNRQFHTEILQLVIIQISIQIPIQIHIQINTITD